MRDPLVMDSGALDAMVSTLGEITELHARHRPDTVALILGNRSWTYGELDREANRVAGALERAGIGPQDRVAFLAKNEAEFFSLLFGAAKMNVVVVAVNWRLAAPEMQHILDDAGAQLLLTTGDYLGHVEGMDLPTVEQVVVLGDDGSDEPGSGDDNISYADWIAGESDEPRPITGSTDDTCGQLYTSGTTGLPKGAEISHHNLLRYVVTAVDGYRFGPEGTNLVAMPLFHIGGIAWAMIGLYRGYTNVMLREFDVDATLDAIERNEVTHGLLVPAMLQFVTQSPRSRETDFSSLEIMVYGASPITERVLVDSMELMGCNFYQGYGLTETAGGITVLKAEDHDPGGPRAHLLRSAGEVWGDVDLRIVDPATGEDVEPGGVGEIWCRTAQNMLGYWNNPEATADVFPEGRDEHGLGWFRTGDAASIEDGYLFIRDRVKDMIVSRAENIYPAEVENALMSHPAVTDVAVIGVPDERWGETVKAIVVAATDTSPGEAALIAHCRERLAGYKCPRSVDFTDELPRNPSGKILKTELRKPYWAGRGRMVN